MDPRQQASGACSPIKVPSYHYKISFCGENMVSHYQYKDAVLPGPILQMFYELISQILYKFMLLL